MTNTYNTGNPLGSTDPRDLLDNASNLDDAMNSAAATFTDRLGVQRDTWAGQENTFGISQAGREAEFQQFLTDSGFVSLGNYAPGLNFTAYNQYMARDGFFYRPAPSSIPFTTTGTWVAGDENLFVLLSADDVLRQDLANTADPDKGASINGNGVVSVVSIASLLLQQQRSDLRYLVYSYYAGEDIGGGEFYWDAVSTETENLGTVFAVVGVPTGRFKRIVTDTYIRTSQFGIDRTGATSATVKLQAMIDLEIPIWLDEGTYLIDTTVFYRNTTMHGPGLLNIVVDANYTPIGVGFLMDDAVFIPPGASTDPETYNVDFDVKAVFHNSVLGKPHTPFRFLRLRESKVRMDISCTGSGDVTSTNLPDFYFDNRDVRISGRYVVAQRDVSLEGGMWVRDVGLAGADSATRYSENVVVESDTYIENDGVDEALAFFNPSGGTLYNCGVLAATLVGGGLGLSILEFNAASRSQTRMDCYAIGTKVRVNSLRTSQAAVKFSKAVARVIGVNAYIYGFRDIATAGQFYAGFRNADPRTQPEYPELIGCKAVTATVTVPASPVIGYDGQLRLVDCCIERVPGGIAFNYGARNGSYVHGGRWPDASTFTFDSIPDVMDARPGTVTYNNVTRRRGIGVYKVESLSPDGSGNVTLTHGLGANPTFASAQLENNTVADIAIISRNSSSVIARIFTRSTGAAITTGSFSVIWKAEV